MSGFGSRFKALPAAAIDAAATPPSGRSQEAIWHQLYDTQLYTSAATLRQQFFQTPNVDRTITNIQQGGTLPSPQSLQIHNVCLDVLSILPVTTGAAPAGVLNDLALLIFGSNERPTWTLTINQKDYGPYSLTTLHGTGGPSGWGWGTTTADTVVNQYAKNTESAGWNYFGRVIILPQNAYSLAIDWAAAATLSANKRIRVSLFGVLSRKVQ